MDVDSFIRRNKALLKDSERSVKQCYFPKCDNTPIKAHSISNNRLLKALSDDGAVLEINWDPANGYHFTECGRGVASTFRGFCDKHDKIFGRIDVEDYAVDDLEQEFLFALRGAARELNAKKVASASMDAMISGNNHQGMKVIDELKSDAEYFNFGQNLSIRDQFFTRSIFMDTLAKKKYHVLETVRIVMDGSYPIVASSSFNMELSISGDVINDVSPSGYSTKMKPCFFTLFPQNDKTFCLISYFRRYKEDYAFLREFESADEDTKKNLVSNLLVLYIENFYIKPSYWTKIDNETKNKLVYLFGRTLIRNFSRELILPIEDADFNLFQ